MLKNPDSRSKAQNLNYALDVIGGGADVIAIMDADHQPSPDALGHALAAMDATGAQVVQGHCAIRNVDDAFLPGAPAATASHHPCTVLFMQDALMYGRQHPMLRC